MFVKITKMQQSVSEVCVCVQVSDHGVLLLELDCGLNFPVTEHLSRLVYRHALHGETRARMHTCTQTHTHAHRHARTDTHAHRHKRMLGVGIAGYLTIRYNHDTWLTVTIISRCSDSAITDIFLENPIMLHHDIGLNKMPVKRLGASFLSLFKSKLLENSKKKDL